MLRLGRALTNLQTLDLSGCDELTDQALGSISCLANLRHLNLHMCSSITGKGFKAALQPLSNIESINLTDTQVVSRDSIAALSKLSGTLKSLSLGHCEVNPSVLKQLAELEELTELDLSDCQSTYLFPQPDRASNNRDLRFPTSSNRFNRYY